ncbi:MAG: hypothetical protein ACRCY8_18635 [Dermatophilaceae bacterium]
MRSLDDTADDAADDAAPVGRPGSPGTWCGQCAEPLAGGADGDGDTDGADHGRCAARAELEPPRYCAHCRRRMTVQVTPGAWTATCSRHGTVEQATWR